MKALFAALQTNGDWQLLVYDLTALTVFGAEGFSVIDYEASLLCAQEGCWIRCIIADHLLGPCWGSPGPGVVKVPVLRTPGKLPTRNLFFAADTEKEPKKLYFFPMALFGGIWEQYRNWRIMLLCMLRVTFSKNQQEFSILYIYLINLN